MERSVLVNTWLGETYTSVILFSLQSLLQFDAQSSPSLYGNGQRIHNTYPGHKMIVLMDGLQTLPAALELGEPQLRPHPRGNPIEHGSTTLKVDDFVQCTIIRRIWIGAQDVVECVVTQPLNKSESHSSASQRPLPRRSQNTQVHHDLMILSQTNHAFLDNARVLHSIHDQLVVKGLDIVVIHVWMTIVREGLGRKDAPSVPGDLSTSVKVQVQGSQTTLLSDSLLVVPHLSTIDQVAFRPVARSSPSN